MGVWDPFSGTARGFAEGDRVLLSEAQRLRSEPYFRRSYRIPQGYDRRRRGIRGIVVDAQGELLHVFASGSAGVFSRAGWPQR